MRLVEYALLALGSLAVQGPGRHAAGSTVILLEAQAQDRVQRLLLLACLSAVGLASYITLAVAGRGARWLSPIVLKITTRLMGLVLASVAIQFIFNALKGPGGLLGR